MSIIAKFCAATYACNSDINVLTIATGADNIAVNSSNDTPSTENFPKLITKCLSKTVFSRFITSWSSGKV